MTGATLGSKPVSEGRRGGREVLTPHHKRYLKNKQMQNTQIQQQKYKNTNTVSEGRQGGGGTHNTEKVSQIPNTQTQTKTNTIVKV